MWFNFFLMDDLPFLLVKVGRDFNGNIKNNI